MRISGSSSSIPLLESQSSSSSSEELVDIRQSYPSALIQQQLKTVQYSYIPPTAPLNPNNNTITSTKPYLTLQEHMSIGELPILGGCSKEEQENKKEEIQASLNTLHSCFTNLSSQDYQVENNTSITIQEKDNSTLKVTYLPNCICYTEYPTRNVVSTIQGQGSYKSFYIQNHKGRTIPTSRISHDTQKRQKESKEKLEGKMELIGKVMPKLTQQLLYARTQNIPGSELIVIPEIAEKPSPENENSLTLIQSYYGQECLQTRVTREHKEKISTPQSAKHRLRDIVMANQALFDIGLYNLDIKPENSIISEENGIERICQIDIDDLAIKHYTTTEEKLRILNKRGYDVFSDAPEYRVLQELTSYIMDTDLRTQVFTILYQNKAFMKTFHSLLPTHSASTSLIPRLLLCSSYKRDPMLMFITTPFPIAFLEKLLEYYKKDTSLSPLRREASYRIKKIIRSYQKAMDKQETKLLNSMNVRIALLKYFSPVDEMIIRDRNNGSYFLDIPPDNKKEIHFYDWDSIDSILECPTYTSSPLNSTMKKYLLDNLDSCTKSLRDFYHIGAEVTTQEMNALTEFLIDSTTLQTNYRYARPRTQESYPTYLHQQAIYLRGIIKKICDIDGYQSANIPHNIGMIPVLNNTAIAELRHSLQSTHKDSLTQDIQSLSLSNAEQPTSMPPHSASVQVPHESIYDDMPPLEE